MLRRGTMEGRGKKKMEWWRKVRKYLFAIMSNSIFPSASLLSGAIMESVFVWWQGNRPALFRLVSAIMKKHHQPWMEAWHSVFHDTRQIITIDCYLGTRKKDSGRKSKGWWTGRVETGIKSQFFVVVAVVDFLFDFFFVFVFAYFPIFYFLFFWSEHELLLEKTRSSAKISQHKMLLNTSSNSPFCFNVADFGVQNIKNIGEKFSISCQ